MKTLAIDWLEPCPNCNSKLVMVKTLGRRDFLYEGDEVKCGCCPMKGVIEVFDSESADCVWDEIGLVKEQPHD